MNSIPWYACTIILFEFVIIISIIIGTTNGVIKWMKEETKFQEINFGLWSMNLKEFKNKFNANLLQIGDKYFIQGNIYACVVCIKDNEVFYHLSKEEGW